MTILLIALGTASGCTTDEFLRIAGQSLYDAGRYVCTQSSNCDSAGGGVDAARR